MSEVVKKGKSASVKIYQILDAIDCAIDLYRDPSLGRVKRTVTATKKVVKNHQ